MDLRFEVASGTATLVGERREGVGTPLALLHGFGGTGSDWAAVECALPAGMPLLRYDLRGFGNSAPLPEEPYSHADDLLAVLDALAIEQTDLCGMSLGGATALNFALAHPHRVRRLVLVSPLIVGWGWSADWIERWKAIGRKARAGEMDAARDLWWRHPLFEGARRSSRSADLRTAILDYSGEHWIADPQRLELSDVERLHTLAVPTLLLTGVRDTQDFRLIADVIDNAVESVKRVDYPCAGHMLNFEKPEAIAAEIARFLA